MPTFRKKPVVIQAVFFDGTNGLEIESWSDGACESMGNKGVKWVQIMTLEGVMKGMEGDWIIRGVKGEYYPCKPDIFDMTYERHHD